MDRRYVLTALLTLWVAAPLAAARTAETPDAAITVGGEGIVSTAPDTARVEVGVITEAGKAAAALADNNRAMQKLFDTLATHKIVQRDVQTRSFSVRPRYRRTAQGEPPDITGYLVDNQLTVTVRKIDGLGKLLDALVSGGANRVGGIRFSVADPAALLDKARTAAVEDARRRAGVLARAAGLKLGKVVFVREHGAPPPAPMRAEAAMVQAEGNVPLARGELLLRVHITAGFATDG